MEIDPIQIEEKCKLGKEHVHVDRKENGEDEEGKGTNELVHILVCNHRKWRRVVELVVALVDVPPER